jgi:hypothetical protein
MRWNELDNDTQRILLDIADSALKSELGFGRPARCAACYYWEPLRPPLVDRRSARLVATGTGICRRRAPLDRFPATLADEWCGDCRMLTVDDLALRIWDERQRLLEGGE